MATAALCAFLSACLAGAPPDVVVDPAPVPTLRATPQGEGARSYWLYEPAGAPAGRAPVVVFLHGWMALNPGFYGAWIEHLVRRGNVVVFPRYQDDWATPPGRFLPNAIAALRDALDVLETGPGRVRPDRGRVAVIGHSAGGNLAVLLAAAVAGAPDAADLPPIRAVVAVFPGEVRPAPGPTPADLPPDTRLVILAGDRDVVVGDGRARSLFAGAAAVPGDRKRYILLRTSEGAGVTAEHFAPTAVSDRIDTGEGPLRETQRARAKTDALDREVFWPVADRTLDAAFANRPLDALDALLAACGLPLVAARDLAIVPRVPLPHGARMISWNPEDWSSRRLSR
jgi:pimeloyl-ACP methyl ester carboxylesterase